MAVVIKNNTIIKNSSSSAQVSVLGIEENLNYIQFYINITPDVTSKGFMFLFDGAGIIKKIDWGDGTIEDSDSWVTDHFYSALGRYTITCYLYPNLPSPLPFMFISENKYTNSAITGWNFKRIGSNLTDLTIDTPTYLEEFDFSDLTVITRINMFGSPSPYVPKLWTYTAGLLGKNNPNLNNIILIATHFQFSQNELNLLLIDLQTYCLNNNGALTVNIANGVTPSGAGLTAYDALTSAGWTITYTYTP